MSFIDFAEVEKLATIEDLAHMLGLKIKRYNASQIRCACPVHGGEDTTLASPGVRSKRGSEGVFYCQKAKSGGDRIGPRCALYLHWPTRRGLLLQSNLARRLVLKPVQSTVL